MAPRVSACRAPRSPLEPRWPRSLVRFLGRRGYYVPVSTLHGLPLLFVALQVACTTAPPADEPPTPTPEDDGLIAVDRAACLVDPDCDYLFAVGHRGASLHAPENTILGFEVAESFGLDVVELDVRPTSDDVLVLMHDSSVDRTTDGVGPISEMTLAEVRQLSATSDFEGIDDQPVPTFVEALLALAPSTLVNVDAKTSRWDLIHAALVEADFLDRAWVQTDDAVETAEVLAAFPDLILMPDASSPDEVDALAPFAPATIEIPLQELDSAIFEACVAHGIKPAQNSLGFADIGATADVEQGGDGSRPYRVMVERGAQIIQTDAPELLVPALTTMNAERGYHSGDGA